MNAINMPDGFEQRIKAADGEILPPSADGTAAARVGAGRLLEALGALKDGPGTRFDMLADICSVDEHPREPRFDVIYHLRCLATGELMRLKVYAERAGSGADERFEVPSAMPLYGTADWHEREAYDMMGIVFTGREGLKRILMPLEYEHHPLRKDFPLEGIEPDKPFKERFPEKSIGSMHQKPVKE